MQTQLHRSKTDVENLLYTSSAQKCMLLLLFLTTAVLKILLYLFYEQKTDSELGKILFYSNPPNELILILVIKAHLSDCWEPCSQIQCQEGEEESSEEMAVSLNPPHSKGQTSGQKVICRCLSWIDCEL